MRDIRDDMSGIGLALTPAGAGLGDAACGADWPPPPSECIKVCQSIDKRKAPLL